jgi:proline- and glutamine-rich splicing factor
MEKVASMSGPTYDLPPGDATERKFSGHCRLYVGNLTNDITEEEVTSLFAPFGQTAELFLNKEKNFAFIRLVSALFRLLEFGIYDVFGCSGLPGRC